MRSIYWLNLQFFAGEGASSGGDGGAAGVSSAAAGQSTGVTTADAGQDYEARLEKLGVPKNKIRKGAYKPHSDPAASTAQTEQVKAETSSEENKAENPEEQSGAASRRSWDDVKSDYKAEYDAEVQDTIKKRVKSERDRAQRYIDRESARAPMDMFFAERYGLDPDSDDFYDQMVEKWRADNTLSQGKALENGRDDELQHKLDVASADEMATRVKKAREAKLQAAFDNARKKADDAKAHLDNLIQQSAGLDQKIPGFDLLRELDNEEFVSMVQPGSKVTVEHAYYACHPEYWEHRIQDEVRKATEALAASVRAGAARPAENGSQAASVGNVPYRDRPKAEREDLKRRIYAAGYEGKHIPVGG